MQVEVVPEDLAVRSLVGDPQPTREVALARVQDLLDRAAASSPVMGRYARAWRAGAAQDTLGAGVFTWAVYEAPDGDVLAGARAWLAEWATELRAAGVDVVVHEPVRRRD